MIQSLSEGRRITGNQLAQPASKQKLETDTSGLGRDMGGGMTMMMMMVVFCSLFY